MSNAVGKQQGGGFMANSPTPEDIFKAIGLEVGGWDGINSGPAGQGMEDQKRAANDDLKKCFAQVYASPAGKKVVEAMLDQTLRRSPYLNDPQATLDQQTAYGLERKGQNGLATWFLSMIHAGQNIKPAASKGKKKK